MSDSLEDFSAGGWTLEATLPTAPPLLVEVRILLAEAPLSAQEGEPRETRCALSPNMAQQRLDQQASEALILQLHEAQEEGQRSLAPSPELVGLLAVGIRSILSEWEKDPKAVVGRLALSNLVCSKEYRAVLAAVNS